MYSVQAPPTSGAGADFTLATLGAEWAEVGHTHQLYIRTYQGLTYVS